jgi:hypothetical protein
MSWEVASGIAEIVGALAVVVSLLYLAYEVRANTRVLTANSGKDAQIQWAIVNEALWQSPHHMVIANALDPEASSTDFSPEDHQRVFWFARVMLQRFESELFQYQAGLWDEEIWEAHRTWAAGFLTLPVFRDWWAKERMQPLYTQSFINSIESVDPAKLPDLLATLARPHPDPSTAKGP